MPKYVIRMIWFNSVPEASHRIAFPNISFLLVILCTSFPGSGDFVLLNTCDRNTALFPSV